MEGNSKFVAGLLVGAAAGVALAIFLNSEKGKDVLSGIKSTAGKYGDEIKDVVGKISDKKDQLVEKITDKKDELVEKIADKKDELLGSNNSHQNSKTQKETAS